MDIAVRAHLCCWKLIYLSDVKLWSVLLRCFAFCRMRTMTASTFKFLKPDLQKLKKIPQHFLVIFVIPVKIYGNVLRVLMLFLLCLNGVFIGFFGFNGTAGVWRMKAVEDYGAMECVVVLLCLLSNENDDSKYVQILETGSAKAKEDSATILGNLCNHNEDIRECVESADSVPALLWLLKNGSSNGKEIASKTLNHLIHKSDITTVSQLNALLTSELPESKVYVLDALKSLLSMVPLTDYYVKVVLQMTQLR
ncbi:putative xyloglucan 6-xylosyltransferase [Helianthus annuus]|nr:putative xyloglucan 6-xylosyltransferase [Helianthus annuus]KAJ0748125.1 putative xyloglucan 6-xylosyltransferase [Helianthus annuus]